MNKDKQMYRWYSSLATATGLEPMNSYNFLHRFAPLPPDKESQQLPESEPLLAGLSKVGRDLELQKTGIEFYASLRGGQRRFTLRRSKERQAALRATGATGGYTAGTVTMPSARVELEECSENAETTGRGESVKIK